MLAINSINAGFDTELRVTAPFTGVAQSLGTLTTTPAILFFKNDSTVEVFFADNSGTTKGLTMTPGEKIVLDCSTNRTAVAPTLNFPIGTQFFVTGTGGTGAFRVGVISAR